MFRNVRTEPRRFQFRSRHLPDLDPKWAERKERIEAEVAGSKTPTPHPHGPFGFVPAAPRRRLRKAPPNGRNGGKRHPRSAVRHARAVVIAAGLVWLAWRGWYGWRPVIFRMY